MNSLIPPSTTGLVFSQAARRHWATALFLGLTLLLGACATAPPSTTELTPSPATAPLPENKDTPVDAEQAVINPQEPVLPLKPRSNLGLTPPTDVWERIRRGFAMPDLDSDLVRNREQWYSGRPDYMLRMTERSRPYLFHVVEELERRNMPTELALLPFIESAFNPQAVSSAKAAGMWQFMPATGKFFDLKQNLFRDDRRDVLESTRAALDYLQNGLLPEDVVFVEVGSSAGVVDALRTGAIDALCNPDPVMYGLEQKNEIRVMGETRTLMSTRKLMGGPVPGACLFARADFLQRQSDVAQALSDAVVHALKWLQTAGLTDILKTVPAPHWFGDRAVYLGAFEKLRESYALDGLIDGDAVRTAWRAHSRLPGRLNGVRLSVAPTYTNAFAVKSKSRFAA